MTQSVPLLSPNIVLTLNNQQFMFNIQLICWTLSMESSERVSAVLAAADRSGLLLDRSGRIGGRVSPALVREAKRRTGIESDSDLIAFALASLALEDAFPQTFRELKGSIEQELELGF